MVVARRAGHGLLRLGPAAHPAVAGMTALTDAASPAPAASPRRRRSGPGRAGVGAWRCAVLAVLGLYFLVPLARLDLVHGPRPPQGGVTLEPYTAIPGAEGFAEAFGRSLLLAGADRRARAAAHGAVVVLVELRLPRLRTTVEVLTLLPLVLPPIALVVGVRSVLAWGPDYFLDTPSPSSSRSRSRRCPGSSCWSTSSSRCRSSTARSTPGSAGRTCAPSSRPPATWARPGRR